MIHFASGEERTVQAGKDFRMEGKATAQVKLTVPMGSSSGSSSHDGAGPAKNAANSTEATMTNNIARTTLSLVGPSEALRGREGWSMVATNLAVRRTGLHN
jgi:hypothetical protein